MFMEFSNGTGIGKVPKNIGESSPNQGPTSDNKASDSAEPLENHWDVEFCHKELKITNNKELKITKLKVECDNQKIGTRSAFAKYPISLNNDSTGIFYFEIKKTTDSYSYFGFADKKRENLGKMLWQQDHTSAYMGIDFFIINGSRTGKGRNTKKGGDVAGIGVHLNTRKIFFTKNGQLLDSPSFSLSPSYTVAQLFPFVTLTPSAGAEVESNFGPDFKFDLATL
ncbi:hypothetical protein niasHT_029946 [Heterodera trifolii]|uniref:B30.2/SPRY domain-containing protein n=1 Tax=Heterodera trifolii TaxID=157864 RepID=A0ABD2JVQ0_9BILA